MVRELVRAAIHFGVSQFLFLEPNRNRLGRTRDLFLEMLRVGFIERKIEPARPTATDPALTADCV